MDVALLNKAPVEEWAHETTYARKDPSGIIHRNRLNGVIQAFKDLHLADKGTLIDFGCSNGFVVRQLQANVFPGKSWVFDLTDVDDRLLEYGKAFNMPNTSFRHFDLDYPDPVTPTNDVVLCVSTLEHSAGYRSGLQVLLDACKPGGYIVIGLPYENGLAGIVKFLGRDVLRRHAYNDFFEHTSRWTYFWTLVTGGRLDQFRNRGAKGYPHHLGWDIRPFRTAMFDLYEGKADLVMHRRTLGSCNWLWVFRKK